MGTLLRTKRQNKRLFGLLNALYLTEEERGVLVGSFTDGRTCSSAEMTIVECEALIDHLQRQFDGSTKKMRAKAINIALDIGLIKKERINTVSVTGSILNTSDKIVDWEPLNKWTGRNWKQPFYKLDYDQLRKCITALENWRDGKTDKMIKTL